METDVVGKCYTAMQTSLAGLKEGAAGKVEETVGLLDRADGSWSCAMMADAKVSTTVRGSAGGGARSGEAGAWRRRLRL